jgi:hypothetical protein
MAEIDSTVLVDIAVFIYADTSLSGMSCIFREDFSPDFQFLRIFSAQQ